MDHNELYEIERQLITRFHIQPQYSLEEYIQARFAGRPISDPAWDAIFASIDEEQQENDRSVYGFAQMVARQMPAQSGRPATEGGMNSHITPAGVSPV